LAWSIQTDLEVQIAVIEVKDVHVANQKAAFERLKECAASYSSEHQGKSVGNIEGVQAARRLFRAIGIDPTRRRPSSEALLHRALKGKPFYSVNSLVDVGNWCSLDFLLPICVYDHDKIVGGITIRRGKDEESYIGLNNRTVNLHHRYVISDANGAFGSPITDSLRTAVDEQTKRAVLVIFAPVNYDSQLLRSRADIFAERAIGICGVHSVGVQILGNRKV
jgi:DNA/RNA-binding domain of Phe-tRNA-synthetase-like protein